MTCRRCPNEAEAFSADCGECSPLPLSPRGEVSLAIVAAFLALVLGAMAYVGV